MIRPALPIVLIPALWSGVPAAAWAAGGGAAHSDPIAPVILGVTGLLSCAVLGRFAARRIGQPSVLGELVMGLILGNTLYYFGVDMILVLREGPAIFDLVERILRGGGLEETAAATLGAGTGARVLGILQGPHGAELLQVAHTVDVFSRYGVIFLLFLVGLETDIRELKRVGGASIRVAVIGVAAPFVLGFLVTRWLLPDYSLSGDLFIAAALGATSIGLTARVLRDLHQHTSRESHVILGAAVIDDILGLILLAIVSGIVVAGGVSLASVAQTILLAAAFVVGAFVLGPYFIRFVVRLVRHLDIIEAKMFISFLFVMVLAWFANLVGLATIVGAFAAGLILHDAYFQYWGDVRRHRFTIKDLIAPLEVILVPIFFVLMGLQVKLESFFDPKVIVIAFGLLIAAVIGKLIAGLGAERGMNRFAIGAGMLPRGEVGLVFASIGKTLGVIDDALFSAIVLMVIVTTVMTPPLLKISLQRRPPEDQPTTSR